MYLTADKRRQTQTFCPVDPAGQNLQALRAGGAAAPGDVLDELRLDPHREAIAGFIRTGRSDERFMQQNAKAFSCRLRRSAGVCGKEMTSTHFAGQE
jgi:hypothetical protein